MASVGIIVTKSIFLSLFIVLAIVGNISVIYVVLHVKKLNTIPNYFVVNLAVADLLFALTGIPMILVTAIAKEWILGSALCNIGGFLNSLFCLASIWTLAMISINRYFAVSKATTVKDIYTKKRTKVVIAFVWVWSAAIACPPLFGWSRFKAGENFCTIDGQKDLPYSIMVVILAYFIPLLILAGLYCKIFFMLKDHQNTLKQGKIPHFQSYGAGDGDSSTNVSDSDSISSVHGYSIKKTPSQKGLEVLARFTKKRSIKGANKSSIEDGVSGGCVKIEINEPESSEVSSISFAGSLKSRSSIVSAPSEHKLATVLQSNDARNSRPIATISVFPSGSLKNSMENVNAWELKPSGTLQSKPAHATRRKKKRIALRLFKEVKVTKMLLTVVAVFFFCWTPFVVASILYGLNITVRYFELMTLAIMLACLNSVCNPVIYAMMNKNFRDGFVQLCQKFVGCRCSSNMVTEES